MNFRATVSSIVLGQMKVFLYQPIYRGYSSSDRLFKDFFSYFSSMCYRTKAPSEKVSLFADIDVVQP